MILAEVGTGRNQEDLLLAETGKNFLGVMHFSLSSRVTQ